MKELANDPLVPASDNRSGANVDLRGPKVMGSKSAPNGPVPVEVMDKAGWAPAGKPSLASPKSPNDRRKSMTKG